MSGTASGVGAADPAAPGVLRYGCTLMGLDLVPGQGVLTELVAAVMVYPVPKARGGLRGLMNQRGSLVPVFDPALLAQPPSLLQPSLCNVLVFGREEERAGVVVQTPPALVSLSPAPPDLPRPEHLLAAALTRAWVQPGPALRVWWEVDHQAVWALLAAPATRP